MTATSKLTLFWQDAFGTAAFAAGLAILIGFFSIDFGAVFLGAGFCAAMIGAAAALLDAGLRLAGFRITIERVRR